MPYWLESDTFHDDPIWSVLAGRNSVMRDALQAGYARLKSAASHHRTDGYLTADQALGQARTRVLSRLCDAVLDRAALIHRRGDTCTCLGDGWIDGYDYRIHEFLKRNPSRAENDRNKAQKADLRDAALKSTVYGRDGGCCRYCGSGPLNPKAGRARDRRRALHYDHVDPDQPAGPDAENLVTACARCNEYKGHRTPDEAGMVLLAVPTAEQAAVLRARTERLFDRPGPDAADQRPINDGTATEQRSVADPITDRITDPLGDREPDPNDNTAAELCPEQGEHQPATATASSGKGAGSGRVPAVGGGGPAPPTTGTGGQPVRGPDSPDIYHRRSRSPTHPRDSP